MNSIKKKKIVPNDNKLNLDYLIYNLTVRKKGKKKMLIRSYGRMQSF